MLFNSPQFLFVFLPLTALLFFAIARVSHWAAAAFLTFASFYFYAQFKFHFLYIIVPSIVLNYYAGVALSSLDRIQGSEARRKSVLIAAIAGNLLCLAYFKYVNFFISIVNSTGFVSLGDLRVELPLGISFFTFTQIAYLVDTYQRKATEPRFTHFALFVTYFPHLIAGPVLHHKEMMPQFSLASTYRISAENLAVGLTIFVIGLFKKVVLADGVAPHVHLVFDAAHHGTALTTLEAWSGALGYTLQIYFDFSGYSDMAIGLSRLFGVRLPLNFDSPYKAANIIEFWRRWHMTLSRFLRDYLYIPLGGNRHGAVRMFVNMMVVMLLGGLWHGAGWTFVIWGGLHGVFLVANHLWHMARGETERGNRATRIAAWFLTFLLVTFAWVFFRAPDLATALAVLKGMAGWNGLVVPPMLSAADAWNNVFGTSWFSVGSSPLMPSAGWCAAAALMLGIAWFGPNTQEIMAAYEPALNYALSRRGRAASPLLWRPGWLTAIAAGGLAVYSLVLIVYTKRVGEFLYFQF